MKYESLHPQKIVDTISVLEQRIAERFPNKGLRSVCQELLRIAKNAKQKSEWIGRPILWMRFLVWTACFVFSLLCLVAIYLAFAQLFDAALPVAANSDVEVVKKSLRDLMPNLETELNVLVLIGGAIFFLWTLETGTNGIAR